MNQNIIKQVNAYYTDKLATLGKTVGGVDWNSKESQEIRFEQISKVLPVNRDESFSVCDFGCGIGDYCNYLNRLYTDYSYTGIDVSAKMIDEANKYKNATYLCDSKIDGQYDYIVTSGIFNVKQGTTDKDWKEYILEILKMFSSYAKKGFSFNCLTSYSDKEYMRSDLYYADPLYLFDYCKKHFSRNVALLHDYNIYDFTIIVRM